MSDTESDIEDIPHDEIVKKLKVPVNKTYKNCLMWKIWKFVHFQKSKIEKPKNQIQTYSMASQIWHFGKLDFQIFC